MSSSCQDRVIPIAVLFFVNVLFSGYATLSSLAFCTSALHPVVFAFLRDTVACVCFAGALFASSRLSTEEERGPLIPSLPHLVVFVGLGFLGVYSSMYGALSISLTSPTAYGLLTPIVPCITLLFSFAIGLEQFRVNEGLSWAKAAGIAVSVGGAMVIIGVDAGRGGHCVGSGGTTVGGWVYLLLQKLGVAMYPILQKRALQTLPYSSLTLAAYAYFTGTALVLLNMTTSATKSSDWELSYAGVGAVLFSGILSSFFNYSAMAWANARIGPVLVMSFYPVQSVATPLLAYLFLGAEPLSPAAIGGGVGVVVGLALVLWAKYMEGSPVTGIVVADDEMEEAATLVLTRKDVDVLTNAAILGDDTAVASAVMPLLQRSLSRRNVGGGRGGEALLGGGGREPLYNQHRTRAASASAIYIATTVRHRLTREKSVAVYLN